MKKRLLITSIVMMLVVAVALSTATYAWFTSNAKVEASSMTLKAATSSASALGIGWTGLGAGTSIESDVAGVVEPMAPATLSVGTTAAETLTYATGTTKQVGGVYKFNKAGETENPLVYNKNVGTVEAPVMKSSFYVKNLSNANKINTVTVTAVFTGDQAYTVTSDPTVQDGVTYYTRSGDEAPYTYAPASVNTGDSITENTLYEYTPYIKTKDTSIVAGTTYYTNSGSKFTKVASPVAGEIGTYYEKITADDLIRVALFTKEYRQANDGVATFSAQGSYYAYNSNTDVIEAVDSPVQAAFTNKEYYTVSSANHLLKCVLGNKANHPGRLEGVNDTYDLNKVYYQLNDSVLEKVTVESASDYATKKAQGLYTCDRGTVYGTIAADKAVNAMDYYTGVVNEFVIAEDLLPGEQIDIVAYVWMDGTALDDYRQSELGSVSLQFAA